MSLKLHDCQKAVLEDKSTRKLVIVGAGWGKTTLALEMGLDRCRSTPGRHVKIFEHNMHMVYQCREYLFRRMIELGDKFLTESPVGFFRFQNGSTLELDIFPYNHNEELIFDDALDMVKDLTIMFTPIGWSLHNGPSTQNPSVDLPARIKNMYSQEYYNQMFEAMMDNKQEEKP